VAVNEPAQPVARTWREAEPWWPEPVRAPDGAPNIVMIVFDDVGFSDFGCYGSEIETPRIDGLAQQGLRYTNFHTTSLCSPTRACLLTGRNHHSVGMGVVSNWDTGFPGYRGRITHRAGTLAEILRPAGYNTFAVGKWHLTPPDETTAAGPFDQWPLQRGFDRFYGFLDGATDQYSPDLVVDNHRIDAPRRAGYHLSEDLVDQSIALLRDQRSAYPEKPFFLYHCFGTAHYPLQAPPDVIDVYRERYGVGWDRVRDERFARQKATGIVPPTTVLAPTNTGVAAWDELDADDQRIAARLQAAYAAMIHHTDQQIGRLLDELDRLGARDDTVVVLLSDNGGTLEGGPLGSLNYMRYVNGLPPNTAAEILASLDEIGGPTTSAMYPMGWGMASNTPLKRYKQNTHGGGIRDPLIVSWPSRIGDHGAIRSQYHHAIDLAPTLLELAGVPAPDQLGGVPQLPVEGVSMTYSFDDAAAPSTKGVQYFEMLGNSAIWHDGWKAVTYHAPGSDFDDDRWELYHLDEDFSECHDLAGAHPDKVAQLVELWWAEAGKHAVLPLDDRIMERFLVPKPRPITSRRRFVYYSGAHLPSAAMPDIKDVSYSIVAEVVRLGDGTVLSCGDRFSGYALLVIDGRLVHDYNAAGHHHVVRSATAVPTGAARLEYRFTKTGGLCGTGELYVDDSLVGSAEVTRTLGVHISPTGLTVGRSPVSAVGDGYEPPFLFEGDITRVTITIGEDQGANERTALSAIED
jgi:arylsulfatase A-like enzyme